MDPGACCVIVVLAVAIGAAVYFVRRGSRPTEPVGHRGSSVRLDLMQRYGRYTMDAAATSQDESSAIYRDIVLPMYTAAQADPSRFVADLRDQVIPVGGWAALGASRLVWEVLTGDQRGHPAELELHSAALQFLRDRGVPSQRVRGYEWEHWIKIKGPNEPWLRGKPRPSPSEAPITDLAEDELRCIIQVFPDSNSNLIMVRRDIQGGYMSLVDARSSDDDPRRVRWEDKRTGTLNDLYWHIGCTFQVPTYWFDPQMAPYFPLPPPDLR